MLCLQIKKLLAMLFCNFGPSSIFSTSLLQILQKLFNCISLSTACAWIASNEFCSVKAFERETFPDSAAMPVAAQSKLRYFLSAHSKRGSCWHFLGNFTECVLDLSTNSAAVSSRAASVAIFFMLFIVALCSSTNVACAAADLQMASSSNVCRAAAFVADAS